MLVELLEHPALQTLEPETPRETLLFIKAHTIGMVAALEAARYLGLESIEAIYDRTLPNMRRNIDSCAGLKGGAE